MKEIRILALLFILILSLGAEIIVKQDKDGRITVTNKATHSDSDIKFKTSAYSPEIPYSYLLKIKRLANKHNIREDLVIAVAKSESSFNPYAISKKGAVGIMQLMADTATRYGVSNRFDVDQNLEGGIKHLKYLYDKYNNNLPLTLAGYNAGEEAVNSYNGIPPFPETINYINRTMKHMGLKYSGYFKPKPQKKLYKYITKEGRTVITDSPPSTVDGIVEVLE